MLPRALFVATIAICCGISHPAQQDLWQYAPLGEDVWLSWRLDDQRLLFNLTASRSENIGLAISYSHVPVDGFFVNFEGDDFEVFDLHLDYADVANKRFDLVTDANADFFISSAAKTDQSTTVVGWRYLDACQDKNHDLDLQGDILQVFYMVGDVFKREMVTIDLSQKFKFGHRSISLMSVVDYMLEGLEGMKAKTLTIDIKRPNANGDAFCKVLKGIRTGYYTGFKPKLQGYNGENGLISSIAVYQCDPEKTDQLAGYYGYYSGGETTSCNSDPSTYPPAEVCTSLLFMWTPGSPGEVLPTDSGIPTIADKRKGSRLLLRIIYNPGTGFLQDSSGMEIYYTTRTTGLSSVSRLEVGHTSDNHLLVPPGEANWRIAGICSPQCFSKTVQEAKTTSISSISVHAGRSVTDMWVRIYDRKNGKEGKRLVTGFNQEFQPIRGLVPPIQIDLTKDEVIVECRYSSLGTSQIKSGNYWDQDAALCKAILTLTPGVSIEKCLSRPSKESIQRNLEVNLESSLSTMNSDILKLMKVSMENRLDRNKNLYSSNVEGVCGGSFDTFTIDKIDGIPEPVALKKNNCNEIMAERETSIPDNKGMQENKRPTENIPSTEASRTSTEGNESKNVQIMEKKTTSKLTLSTKRSVETVSIGKVPLPEADESINVAFPGQIITATFDLTLNKESEKENNVQGGGSNLSPVEGNALQNAGRDEKKTSETIPKDSSKGMINGFVVHGGDDSTKAGIVTSTTSLKVEVTSPASKISEDVTNAEDTAVSKDIKQTSDKTLITTTDVSSSDSDDEQSDGQDDVTTTKDDLKVKPPIVFPDRISIPSLDAGLGGQDESGEFDEYEGNVDWLGPHDGQSSTDVPADSIAEDNKLINDDTKQKGSNSEAGSTDEEDSTETSDEKEDKNASENSEKNNDMGLIKEDVLKEDFTSTENDENSITATGNAPEQEKNSASENDLKEVTTFSNIPSNNESKDTFSTDKDLGDDSAENDNKESIEVDNAQEDINDDYAPDVDWGLQTDSQDLGSTDLAAVEDKAPSTLNAASGDLKSNGETDSQMNMETEPPTELPEGSVQSSDDSDGDDRPELTTNKDNLSGERINDKFSDTTDKLELSVQQNEALSETVQSPGSKVEEPNINQDNVIFEEDEGAIPALGNLVPDDHDENGNDDDKIMFETELEDDTREEDGKIRVDMSKTEPPSGDTNNMEMNELMEDMLGESATMSSSEGQSLSGNDQQLPPAIQRNSSKFGWANSTKARQQVEQDRAGGATSPPKSVTEPLRKAISGESFKAEPSTFQGGGENAAVTTARTGAGHFICTWLILLLAHIMFTLL